MVEEGVFHGSLDLVSFLTTDISCYVTEQINLQWQVHVVVDIRDADSTGPCLA